MRSCREVQADFMVGDDGETRRPGRYAVGVTHPVESVGTPGAGVEMMTSSTFLTRYGVGGGTSRRMPEGSLMSGFEKPPPPAPTTGKGTETTRA